LPQAGFAYQQLPGDEDENATLNGRLRVKRRNLVLHLLERQSRELLDDRVDTENGCTLEGEHRLVTLLEEWSAMLRRRMFWGV
jgi:hypothetical protein